MRKTIAIVLAAGRGKRMNAAVAKQFLELRNKPVLYYSLKALEESSIDEIILVTGQGQIDYCIKQIVERYHIHKVVQVIEGGAERYDSVYKALKCIDSADYVLIHDGARPFLSNELIETTIEMVQIYKACVPGTPVTETIKEVDEGGIITASPNRSKLWSAQTPQAFDYQAIRSAYDMFFHDNREKRLSVTDDSMVYETYIKKVVKMFMGDYNNLKLTTAEDYQRAQMIANKLWGESEE